MPPHRRKRNRLGWSLLASLFFHATVLPLLLWLVALQFRLPITQRESAPHELELTVTTMTRHLVPRTHVAQSRAAIAVQSSATAQPARRQPPPRELAQLVPKAPPRPPRSVSHPSFAQQLAKDQLQFAQTARQLHAQNNPLAVATSSAEYTLSRHNMFEGNGNQSETAFTVLTPLPGEHFFHNNLSCYYVNYSVQFSGGGTESGDIPWPVCYPQNADRMLPLDRSHALPVPVPQPGFTLAAGTALTSFLQQIYDQRPR